MGYDFHYNFQRKSTSMDFCYEDFLKLIVEEIEKGNYSVEKIGDENGDTGQRSYEIPKEYTKGQKQLTTLYFASDEEHREVIFTGMISGRVKVPEGYDKLFEEKAIIYFSMKF